MKRIILLSILMTVFCTFQAAAQIENEIKSYVDSTEVMVYNGRKMLLQKLSVKEDKKAREIYQYLSDISSESTSSAFSYGEHIYASILFGNWQALITYMQEYKQRINSITYPINDQLVRVLYDRVSEASDSILWESRQAGLDDESQRVIQLLLHLIKQETADSEYNHLLKEYHKQYKPSAYKDFVNAYLPGKKINGSLAYSLGSGMIMPTGRLADNFSSNASVYISMDININRVFSSLYMQASGLHLKVPFSVSSDIETLDFYEDERFHFLEAGLKAGYFMVRNNRFHVAPYVTLSGTAMESTRYDSADDDDREYPVIDSFSCGPGIHTEVKLKDFKSKNMYAYANNTYLSIKFEAGYNYITSFDDSYFKGNARSFSVALVYGLGNF